MFLTWLMLAVALCLSAIAAFYSIIGLVAIFAAAVIPVAIMGTVLEIAKLTVTVWLHEYWQECKRTMKAYLVPAVGVLMLITSMGIFGFLSKAHLDQAVPAGDISAQVAVYDEKIKTQRDNIEAARTALRQMDAQVDQVLGRTTDDKGAERAVQIRRQQAAERTRLQQDISRAQSEIVKLNEQRAPIAAQARKVEAEVGPIKYIAALIYGDNPDANLLEKAVRWVIITLVVVFDPLAIFMLLAATESYKWERARGTSLPQIEINQPASTNQDRLIKWRAKFDRLKEKYKDRNQEKPLPTNPSDLASTDEQADLVMIQPEQVVSQQSQPTPVEQENDQSDNRERVAMRAWKAEHPNSSLKLERRKVQRGEIDQPPWITKMSPRTTFGPEFPTQVIKGDTHVITKNIPHSLYKWNGSQWITVDKLSTDNYTFDDAYIKYLITKIESGEYDPELLNETEREQITEYLSINRPQT